MDDKMNVLVTGGEGYLGKEYIRMLGTDPRIGTIVSIDPRNTTPWDGEDIMYKEKIVRIKMSMSDPNLSEVMKKFKTEKVAHFGWWFDPTHYVQKQWDVNVEGTKCVFYSAVMSKVVKQIIYTGSTTAYGQIPENDHPLKEEEWKKHFEKRISTNYPYSNQKASVDFFIQHFRERTPEINIFWTRAAIVLGGNTPNNIVAYVAKSPFTFGKYMFKVKGDDPQMQFCSEYDINMVLYRATIENWSGPMNVASFGTLPYSEVIRLFGRKQIELPAEVLYKLCSIGWGLRIRDKSLLKFPSSLIDMIRYPWVGDISLMKSKLRLPMYSSVDALLKFRNEFL